MDGIGTVLVIATIDARWSTLIELLTDTHGYRVLCAHSAVEARRVLGSHIIDLVIADQRISEGGCALLADLRISHPEIVRVLAFETAPDDLARAALYQFLHLPLDAEQACLVIQRGLEAREVSRRHRRLARELKLSDRDAAGEPRPASAAGGQQFGGLRFVSESMAAVCRQARIAARTDLPVVIEGEPGTGKATLARAIHDASPRQRRPWLVQRCTGIPEAMLIAELFGLRRTAAGTGSPSASSARSAGAAGVLRVAAGGTVYLDDLAALSPMVQAQLWRFLQDGAPLANPGEPPVRILAGSRQPLKALIKSGQFRRDLYDRLKGFELALPALRDRREDIALLAEHFLHRHAETFRRGVRGLSPRALDKLAAYAWPGNVRELESEIRRLVVVAGSGEHITTEQLSPAVLAPPRPAALDAGKTLKDHVESLEKQLVYETLEHCQWNQSKAADALGLSRVGLANKIRRYGLLDEPSDA